ncbi:MAG: sulfatase [Lacipirellulaceae bacterium]
MPSTLAPDLLSSVAVAIILVTSISTRAEELARPNVVLILADDLGNHDLGCMGSDLHQTPNIDAFAERSVLFTNAYAQPTCSPSRAAILSGKNPARLGIVGHGGIRSMSGGGEFLIAEEYTLAEALRDGGYSTCHIGKWHVGVNEDTVPEAQGFEKVIASNDFCCPGSFHYPYRNKSKSGKALERSAVPDLEGYQSGDHLTYCLGEEAAKYLESRRGNDQPFLLNLWYYAVHTPIEANKEKVDHFKDLVTPRANHDNPNYAALVSHLDDSVGRVLCALEDNGLAENTIVIFFSDNGGEVRKGITSNAPLRSGKTTVYDGGTRVPLIVHWPGVTKPGAQCDESVVGHDLYPTLLAATGVSGRSDQNKAMDGVDLTPLLRDSSGRLKPRSLKWLRYGEAVHYPTYGDDPVFGPSAAIREGDWKMVRRYPTPHGLEERFELFNLIDDPGETNNLAASRPEILDQLKGELTDWQSEIKIPSYRALAYPAFEKLELRE